MPPTPNVILFGESGSGKSSIVNMVAESPLAVVSSSVNGCTFASARYTVNIQGSTFNIYDTAGLDEGDNGTVPKNDAIVQLFRLLKSLDTGVSLLVFCMRGPRIKEAAHRNWRLFHEIICRNKVPIIMAITGLEQEEVMDEWWVRNKGAFQKYGMNAQGVGCITATRGKLSRSGGHRFDEEYEESREKMWRLLRAHHLETPWRMEPIEWFSTIVNVTYESRLCSFLFGMKEKRTVETVVGPGIRQLVDRCEMTEEEARKLGEMLSKDSE
jgi:50S ribosome-binding GTPase